MGSAPHAIPELFYLPPGRALGDDLAPPRTAYFITIPVLLGLVGLSSWLLGDDFGFVLSCLVGTVVGSYTLWGWLFRRQPSRFSTLMAMGLLLGYCGGALNTWITLPRGGMTLTEAMGYAPGVLARGIGAVLLSAAALYFIGEIFEKPIFGKDFHFTVDGRTRNLVCLGALAMIGGYAMHFLAFQGPNSAGGHLNPAGAFLEWFYSPVTAIAVVAFLTAPHWKARIFCGGAATILLLLFTVMGRRNSVYTAVEIVLVVGLSGYRWQGSAIRKILMIGGLAAIVVVCSLTYMLLRIAGWSAAHRQQVTVAKRIEVAGKLVQKGGAVALAGSSTQINLQTRTFVLGFMANVLDGSMQKTPARGADAIQQIKVAIPRILYPDKVPFAEEEMVDELFGFGYGDQANSILTAGATDFSLIGVLVYPLLIVGIYRIVFDLASKFFGIVPMMFIALSMIYTIMQTEHSVTGYFELLLVAPFFGLAIALFMALPVMKLSPQ